MPSTKRARLLTPCSSPQVTISDDDKLCIPEATNAVHDVANALHEVPTLVTIPFEIFRIICEYLQPTKKDLDSVAPQHIYREAQELGRRQYLRLQPGFFGHIPGKSAKSSIWPLLQTCFAIRDRVLGLGLMRQTRALVNILDLEAFADLRLTSVHGERLQPVQFHSVIIFVPGGMHPPLPVHPFRTLAQAKIPVKFDFNATFKGVGAAATSDSRPRLEETVRRVQGWLSEGEGEGAGACDSTATLPRLLDKIYVHPGGELYVFPNQAYKTQHKAPREWTKWWPGWSTEWVPTVQELQTALEPLHLVTRTPVWVDVSPRPPWSGDRDEVRPPPERFPFPNKAYQERDGCRSLDEVLGRANGPCVREIRIGDPCGYRLYPTDEFLHSASWEHRLHCLHIPLSLGGSTICLELFGGVGDDADRRGGTAGQTKRATLQNTKRERCGVHCLFGVEQWREKWAEAVAVRSKEQQDECTEEDEDEDAESPTEMDTSKSDTGSLSAEDDVTTDEGEDNEDGEEDEIMEDDGDEIMEENDEEKDDAKSLTDMETSHSSDLSLSSLEDENDEIMSDTTSEGHGMETDDEPLTDLDDNC